MIKSNYRPVLVNTSSPTAIVFRVYGLRVLSDEKLRELETMLEKYFHQAILVVRDSITVYCDAPNNPDDLPGDTAKIQRLSFVLREKISVGLGFSLEYEFSRL